MRDIYSIERDIAECVKFDENGNDIGTDWDRLERLSMEREAKLENVAAWYKNTAIEFDAVKAEKARLEDRQRVLANRMTAIKLWLSEHLQGENITSGRVKTHYHTTRDCVDVLDEKQIPDMFLRVKTEPNLTAIKAAIKGGEPVPGAQLVDRISLVVK